MNIKVLGAVALLALTGCSSSDDIDTVPDNSKDQTEDIAIGFSSYLGNAVNTRAMGTRAEAYTGGEIKDASALATVGFGVFAYYTKTEKYSTTTSPTPNFMYNTKVTGTTADGKIIWNYSPLRYWPNKTSGKDQYVSFFAYAPHVSSETSGYGITGMSTNSDAGDPTVTYTAKDNGSGKYVDLLWADQTSSNTQDKTKSDYNSTTVTFNFKHALAKIASSINIKLDPESGFDNVKDEKGNVTGADANTRVTVNSLTITSDNGTVAESGTLDLATGKWSNLSKPATSPSTTYNTTVLNSSLAEPSSITLTEDGKWPSSMPTGLTTNEVSLLSSSANPILVIPGTGSKFTVEITYTVRTLDSSLANGYTEVKQTVGKDLTLNTEANKQYGLTITVGLNTVKFTASVTDWTTDNSSSVSLPDKLTSTTSTSGN